VDADAWAAWRVCCRCTWRGAEVPRSCHTFWEPDRFVFLAWVLGYETSRRRPRIGFPVMVDILTVIGGGIAGSALTYGLTWVRERRRTNDAYRAPQRVAIADIVEATYELTLRIYSFRDVCEELAKQSEGKDFREIPDAQQEEVSDQTKRALLGVGRAFHAGRLTIVDAKCYEAMGEAFNNFAKLQSALQGVAEMTPTPDNMREKVRSIVSSTEALNADVVSLVYAGQKRLSPVQIRGGISVGAARCANGLRRSTSIRLGISTA
jgi:hypothetical protein